MNFLVIALIIILLVGGASYYGYRSGYYRSRGLGGGLGLILLAFVMVLAFGSGLYHGYY